MLLENQELLSDKINRAIISCARSLNF